MTWKAPVGFLLLTLTLTCAPLPAFPAPPKSRARRRGARQPRGREPSARRSGGLARESRPHGGPAAAAPAPARRKRLVRSYRRAGPVACSGAARARRRSTGSWPRGIDADAGASRLQEAIATFSEVIRRKPGVRRGLEQARHRLLPGRRLPALARRLRRGDEAQSRTTSARSRATARSTSSWSSTTRRSSGGAARSRSTRTCSASRSTSGGRRGTAEKKALPHDLGRVLGRGIPRQTAHPPACR